MARVLQEHKLQLMFGPEGRTERVTVGKLLKADLLVLLRAGEKETRYIDIVICETRSGLRLLVQTIIWSDCPEVDAGAIERMVNQAIGKYKEKIMEICAIPPFISNDLIHQYDYLQTSYSKFIEQMLLEKKGIVIVELAEARAIAKELATTTSPEIRRNLPLYILGEYKNEVINGNRSISVSLTLNRGEKQIKTIKKMGLLPSEIGPFLLQGAHLLLDDIAGRYEFIIDPEEEVKQLNDRADVFQRIASWEEALALIEASLLLKPDQAGLHGDVVNIVSRLAEAYYDPYGTSENFTKKATIGLNYYRLGINHLEQFLRSVNINDYKYMNFMSNFWAAARDITQFPNCPEIEVMSSNIMKEKRDMLLRVIETKSLTGEINDETVDLIGYYFFQDYGKIDETPKENYAGRLRAIRAIQNLPKAWEWTIEFATRGIDSTEYKHPEYHAFVEEIKTIQNRNIQVAAEELRRRYMAIEKPEDSDLRHSSRQVFPVVEPIEESPRDVIFHKLDLTSEDWAEGLSSIPRLLGWFPCNKGVDIAWGLKEIFVMKKKGRLKCVYKSDERFFNFWSICYDGKYVWAPVMHRPEPLVVVVDPESEEILEFTSRDGLPPMSHGVEAAPLGPGKICLAGSFGKDPLAGHFDRGWCAILKLENNAKSVEIFHQARIQRDLEMDNTEPMDDINIAFRPVFLVTLVDKQDPFNKRLLLKRSCGPDSYYPLLIDPEKRSVELLYERIATHIISVYVTSHDGDIYWVSTLDADGNKPNLWRIGFPDFKKRAIYKNLEEDGKILFLEGKIHIVGQKWWVADVNGDKFIALKGDIPGGAWYYREVCKSHHYGIMVLTAEDVFRVEFARPLQFKTNSLRN